MAALKPKLNLPTYTQVPLFIGGTVIVATVIVGGFIFNKAKSNSNNNSTPVTVTASITSSPSALKQTASAYNGTYVGSSPVAEGISSASVTVSNNKVSGRGVYAGANNAKIDLKFYGDVDASGNVKGDFSGSGTVEGVTVKGSGTYSGKITGNTANVNYTASGAGETYKGSIVLTKN